MTKISKTRLMFAGLVLISLFTLGYAQVMVWNETVSWVSGFMQEVIQEDNSFLAQSDR